MDFSNLLFRCSSLGYLMQEPVGKTYLQQYTEAVEAYEKQVVSVNKWNSELHGLKIGTATFDKKLDTHNRGVEKLVKLKKEVENLKPLKDKIILSDGCKSHLMDLYVSIKFGRISDIKSKYVEKGKMLEEEAITMYSKITKQYYEKNTERKYNKWIQGECDFPFEAELRVIHDTKVSWDIFTFYRNLAKEINKLYWWQGQGYMWLWDAQVFKLDYILINTPKKFIQAEKDNLIKTFLGTEEEYEEACKEIEKKYTYDDIPYQERLIEFVVERDDEAIATIPKKAEAAREFLNNIKSKNYELAN